MKTFKDTGGRTWMVAINVTAIRRCRAILNVDLPGLIADKCAGLAKLLNDPVALVDTLYVLCKDEADALKITDEDFGRAMAGDTIEAASEAFVAELFDFFPNPRVRAALAKILDAGKKVQELLVADAEAKANAIDAQAIAKILIESSGDSPESSESTPDLSPSANST